jgi:alanine dehydrogenase
MIRRLAEDEIADLLDLESLLPIIEDALIKQDRGAVERPPRPHTHIGEGLESDNPLGMALTMPAYIHGEEYFSTKLLGIFEGNAQRDIPTLNAQIALTDARTGLPVAYMGGTRITNARTSCMGGIAAKHLTSGSVDVGVLGAGTQARWQTRAIATATDVDSVAVYSPSDSKHDCADDLGAELDADVRAVDSPREAVEGASMVVTGTTSTEPVFPADALADGAVVVAVGAYTEEMQELETGVFERAARVFADVPEEVAEIGDLLATDLDAEDLVPLSEVCLGNEGREADDEILVVESVGSAVFDSATSIYVYDQAVEADVGSEFSLEHAE